jgi:hypothetical protein
MISAHVSVQSEEGNRASHHPPPLRWSREVEWPIKPIKGSLTSLLITQPFWGDKAYRVPSTRVSNRAFQDLENFEVMGQLWYG